MDEILLGTEQVILVVEPCYGYRGNLSGFLRLVGFRGRRRAVELLSVM